MDNKNSEFLRALPLREWLWDWFYEWRKPFLEPTAFNIFSADLAKNFVEALERLLGKELYVKKNLGDPDRVPARFHSLLEKCAEEGIVTGVSYPKPMAGWPSLPAISILGHHGMNASGYGLDYDTATVKAVAEILERSALTTWNEDNLICGLFDELKNHGAVDLQKFILFSKNQLADEKYVASRVDGRTTLHWIPASSLIDKSRFLIPAQAVYLRFAEMKNEPPFSRATSNGTAAGSSYEMALHNALCEVVERDSLMIHWLSVITPPQIDLESLAQFKNSTIDAIVSLYKKYEIEVSLLDITTDIGVPVFMAAIKNMPKGWPPVFISPRADLDIESSVAGSLLDGLRAGYWQKVNDGLIKEAGGGEFHIDTLEKRRAYWCLPRSSAKAEFLFDGETKTVGKNIYRKASFAAKLNKIKELFIAKKLDAYIVDINLPIAKEAGLSVFKVISPGLYPLYLDEHFKYLGVPRLYDMPVKMGVFSLPKKEEEFNSWPHPML